MIGTGAKAKRQYDINVTGWGYVWKQLHGKIVSHSHRSLSCSMNPTSWEELQRRKFW